MATKLLKSVTREIFIGHKPYKVTLDTDLTISFVEKGRRTHFTTSLHGCFNLALIDTVMGDYLEKMKRYNAAKVAGKSRMRRPKRPFIERAFDPKYVASLKRVKTKKS